MTVNLRTPFKDFYEIVHNTLILFLLALINNFNLWYFVSSCIHMTDFFLFTSLYLLSLRSISICTWLWDHI